MQKKIIALAVAGLSTAAFAQTNVTIYGVADVSVQGENVSKSISNQATPAEGGQMKIGNNSSLIGFKGTEDLGNGLKSLFQMETNVAQNGASSGANNVAGANSLVPTMRDSFVGLNSKYGTVLGGYLSTPYRSTLTSFDVMPGSTGDGRLENVLGKQYLGTAQLNASIRATAVAYAMPTMYGFNGSIAFTGTGANNLTDNQIAAQPNGALSFNLGWAGYGVDVKGAFQQAKYTGYTTAGTTASVQGYTSYLIGAAYTGMPGLKVSALYGRNTIGTNATSVAGAQKGSNNTISVGASYRFGNNEPALQYANVGSTSGITDNGSNGANQWAARWGYYTSKRTQVYGLISSISNNNNAQYNFLNATAATGNSIQGTNLLTYGVGLRTNF